MKQNDFNPAASYAAPMICTTEISVETGFAQSTWNRGGAGIYGEDDTYDNGIY